MDDQQRVAFAEAASRGEELFCVPGHAPGTRSEFLCIGCGRDLADAALAFESSPAPADSEAHQQLYCSSCRPSHLGPPCRACGLPAPRRSSVLAGDSWWHRECLQCFEPGCSLPLGEMYYEHKGKPYCAEHHTLRTASRCAKCEGPVGRGVSALGRAWHHECFTCSISGAPLGPGSFFIHDGKPVAPAERDNLAPRCAECGEGATSDRLWAMGRRAATHPPNPPLFAWCPRPPYVRLSQRIPVPPSAGRFHHSKCFVCVHCKAHIGERRFVVLDGEPYLEGCYHKVFGGSAPAEMQAAVSGVRRRYAIAVPLSLSNLGGEQGLPRFLAAHKRLMAAAKRGLRERGVLDVHSFLSTAISGLPMLLLSLTFRDDADAQVQARAVALVAGAPTALSHGLPPTPHCPSGGAAERARGQPSVHRVGAAPRLRPRDGTLARAVLVGHDYARA